VRVLLHEQTQAGVEELGELNVPAHEDGMVGRMSGGVMAEKEEEEERLKKGGTATAAAEQESPAKFSFSNMNSVL
jgi:hypothetical protein